MDNQDLQNEAAHIINQLSGKTVFEQQAIIVRLLERIRELQQEVDILENDIKYPRS